MNSSNMLACVIAISTLYSLPVAGSVCITTSGPKVYAYSSLVADLNNDGIDDKYVIFDEHSTINLSLDGIAHNNTYEIFESWALDDGRIKGNYGIPTEIIGVDVDNDGYVDVVAAFGSKVVVRINDGNGVFGGSQQFLALSDYMVMMNRQFQRQKLNIIRILLRMTLTRMVTRI